MTEEKNPYRSNGQERRNDDLTWFGLMWRNFYIQLFAVAIALLVLVINYRHEFYSEAGFYVGVFIPVAMMILIGHNGFYKYWMEYKQRKTK